MPGRSAFQPHPLMRNPHLQTVLPLLLSPRTGRDFFYETLELPDGDFIDLAWLQRPVDGDSRPLVIVFHGLEGSAHSPYARRMMNAVHARGWQGVIMHFRGCSGRMNRLARTYHSGETGDARYVIEQLHQRFPAAPLLGVGYSLGGNMLLKLSGEWARAMPLQAMVSVCAPLRLEECANRMQQGLSRLYQDHLLRSLRRKVLDKFTQHDYSQLINLAPAQVKRLNSFWAFDDAFTAPIHGFASARDYYQRCSAYEYLPAIEIPALVLQARDDPFMTEAVIPEADRLPANVTLEVTPRGGHVGYIEGTRLRPGFWLEARILGYLDEHTQTAGVSR